MAIKRISAKIGLPWGLGEVGGEWEPDASERDASWELYVELITRVAVVDVHRDEGSIRETLSSLHSLFATTRGILRKYGPSIARPKANQSVSFGHIAVAVLNGGVRPFLTRWHPRLQDHEDARPTSVARTDWERQWFGYDVLLRDLDQVGDVLNAFAGILGEACEAKTLLSVAHCRPMADEPVAGPTVPG